MPAPAWPRGRRHIAHYRDVHANQSLDHQRPNPATNGRATVVGSNCAAGAYAWTASPISASLLSPHPPESSPAPASRLPAKPPAASHSTPARAAFSEPDSPQSQSSAPPATQAHTLPRFQPESAAAHSPNQLPAAATCPPWEPAPLP